MSRTTFANAYNNPLFLSSVPDTFVSAASSLAKASSIDIDMIPNILVDFKAARDAPKDELLKNVSQLVGRVPRTTSKAKLFHAYLVARYTTLMGGKQPEYPAWTLVSLRKHVIASLGVPAKAIQKFLQVDGNMKKAMWADIAIWIGIVNEMTNVPSNNNKPCPCEEEIANLKAYLEKHFAKCEKKKAAKK